MYVEPAGFDGKEVLALHFNAPTYFPFDCFSNHSENKTSIQYHYRGLKALNQGYWSSDIEKRKSHFQTAFGLFHLAHNFDKKYFCTREALSHVAGLLGLDSLEEGERYANRLGKTPTIEGLDLPLEREKVSDAHYVCHLMHPGFYSASDLSALEETIRKK